MKAVVQTSMSWNVRSSREGAGGWHACTAELCGVQLAREMGAMGG